MDLPPLPLLLAAAVAVLLTIATLRRSRWGINLRAVTCPGCGAPVPRTRRPASWREALWGGSTCAACGTAMDKWGRKVEGG